ncbi:MAG: Ig domain-containing protein, partial [Planctomycetota bacterium]|nr:Ig domain-containing protein [Planctomycetota bacterium]
MRVFIRVICLLAAFSFLSGCGNITGKEESVGFTLVSSLPGFTVNVPYSANLVVNRTPPDSRVRITLLPHSNPPPGYQNRLPDGLSLSEGGILSGTPTEAGLFCFRVSARLLTNPLIYKKSTIKFQDYTLVVQGFEMETTVPEGIRDANYQFNLIASRNPADTEIECQIANGGLPNGLTLTETGANAGLISGTPTESGVFNFTVRAWVSGFSTNYKEQAYSMAVNTFE